jgi:DNA-binding XRE family transcriptional regulator
MLLSPSTIPPVDPLSITTETLLHLPEMSVAHREGQSLTLAAAAEQIGIGVTTLANYEAGTSKPTLATVQAILAWLQR